VLVFVPTPDTVGSVVAEGASDLLLVIEPVFVANRLGNSVIDQVKELHGDTVVVCVVDSDWLRDPGDVGVTV
jgi:hypothetical protein